MRDDGYGLRPCLSLWECQFTTFLEVHHRVGVEMVDHTAIGCIGKRERAAGVGVVVSPALTAYTTGCEVVHAFLHTLVAEVVVAAEGKDLIRCNLAEILDEFGHFTDAAPEFIAQSEHPE